MEHDHKGVKLLSDGISHHHFQENCESIFRPKGDLLFYQFVLADDFLTHSKTQGVALGYYMLPFQGTFYLIILAISSGITFPFGICNSASQVLFAGFKSLLSDTFIVAVTLKFPFVAFQFIPFMPWAQASSIPPTGIAIDFE